MHQQGNGTARCYVLIPMIRWILFFAVCFASTRAAENASEWQATTWNGERAVVAVSSGWKAIVSLERARLVYFGRADSENNLLFAPVSKRDPAGWGGHRLWLGPQSTWSGGWPPPAAWERSEVESYSQAEGTLRLVVPVAGDGWPRVVRTYHWSGDRLTCIAELSGGTRSVQCIHILQVPPSSLIKVSALPGKISPPGYVLLPSTATPRFTAGFSPPPHVAREGDVLVLRHLKKVMKLGFVPQALIALEKTFALKMDRVTATNISGSEPDHGFFTQVYLGGPEPFIELEQLSPMFPSGENGSFAFEIQGITP